VVLPAWQQPDAYDDGGAPRADERRADDAVDAGAVRRQPMGVVFWISVGWLSLITLAAILARSCPSARRRHRPFRQLAAPFHGGYLLGSDNLGRDVLSRLIYGARVSLIVGVASMVIGLGIGASLGLIAGFIRGRPEAVIMWAVDVVLSFPALVLLISVVAFAGTSLTTISLVLGFLSIPVYARITRAHTLTVGKREFITAARAIGVPTRRIIWHEVVPNVLPQVLSYGLIAVGVVIVVEGSLSFLGLSVSAPTPSWAASSPAVRSSSPGPEPCAGAGRSDVLDRACPQPGRRHSAPSLRGGWAVDAVTDATDTGAAPATVAVEEPLVTVRDLSTASTWAAVRCAPSTG